MRYLAEYVSPGHPDRLADAIADGIVRLAMSRDPDSLVGVEVALHRNTVFVDGRIAGGICDPVVCEDDIVRIVRSVYAKAGYSDFWKPNPDDLHVVADLSIEALGDDERAIRNISDDQNVVRGYALNCPETEYFPPAHFAVLRLGRELVLKNASSAGLLGPDFKLLACVSDDGNDGLRWDRLVFSCQHSDALDNSEVHSLLKRNVSDSLSACFGGNRVLKGLSSISGASLCMNGAGDFIIGGPNGDNGLSGKKLAVDFYGTEIPIGGGAIYGKDYHKADVAGAYKARQFALFLVRKTGARSVETRLAWAPGEEVPCDIEAWSVDEFGLRIRISSDLFPPSDWFSLQCASSELMRKPVRKQEGWNGREYDCGLSRIIF